jgi:hypothetical protein
MVGTSIFGRRVWEAERVQGGERRLLTNRCLAIMAHTQEGRNLLAIIGDEVL